MNGRGEPGARASALPAGGEPPPEVCLVHMPYAAVERPSIALGLLKAYLEEVDLSVEVVYGNLLFADFVGLDVYRLVEASSTADLLGEWTFAAAAFPDFDPDHEEYFRLAAGSTRGLLWAALARHHPTVDKRRLLFALRRRATRFVERLAEEILARRPRIVGCTSTFQQQCAALGLLRRIRELDPEVVTMLGGANCEGPMGRRGHQVFPWVDFVVSGEADGFVGDLCRRIVDDGAELAPETLPEGVWGPAHRRSSPAAAAGDGAGGPPVVQLGGTSPEPPPRAVVREMDDTAVPEYDDYFATLEGLPYARYVAPGLPFETSRGCWWGMKHHCTFCGLNGAGMAYRAKSPERARDEIRGLARRYGIHRLEAVDNILDLSYLDDLLPALAEDPEPYEIFYELKANLRRRHVEMLAGAGVRWIQPGIESLHDDVLAMLRKGNSQGINLQLLRWAREHGIRVEWSLLYGAPGESDAAYEEMARWLPMLTHLQPPNGVWRIRYDRFSPYHFDQEGFGISLTFGDRYRYVYPFEDEVLDDLAYYFEDYSDASRGRIDPTRPGDERRGLSEVRRGVERWSRLFWRDARGGGPRLLVAEAGDRLRVEDGRDPGNVAVYHLPAAAARVYRACETVAAERRLAAVVGRDGGGALSEEELRQALAVLEERALVLRWRGKVVALGTRPPLAELPDPARIPQGRCDDARLMRELAPVSLARSCLRTPGELSLSETFAPAGSPAGEDRAGVSPP